MAYLTNDIYVGSIQMPLCHFSNRSIDGASSQGVFTVDVISNELSIDTFSFVVRFRYDLDYIYAPLGKNAYRDTNGKVFRLPKKGTPQYFRFVPSGSDSLVDINDRTFRVFAGYVAEGIFDFDYGTVVYWYVGGSFFAKGYLKTIERIGKFEWKFTCVSGVGLLDTRMHIGGVYSGAKLITVVRSIIGDAFNVTASSEASNTTIYGHLPYDTSRNNLHRVLFAAGASLVRYNVGYDYTIRWLDGAEINVPPSRIYISGQVDVQMPTNIAEVTEHAFFQTNNDEVVSLYDSNGQVVDNLTVVFDKSPIHHLTTTGTLEVVSSSVNHAVVSGNGTLSGKLYSHTQHIVTVSSRKAGEKERIKRVTENELVSTANSRNVARRVLGFYSSAKTVKSKLKVNNERTGDLLSTVDAFNEETTGILSKMTVTPTSVKGADCEIISGYVPEYFGNNYSNRVLVTASGAWTVPAGVTEIRIVLIGGAQGGKGGYDGKVGLGSGMSYQLYYIDPDYEPLLARVYYPGGNAPQSGGAGGAGGARALHYVADLTVTPNESITFNIGVGGAGGAANGGDGADGTPTTATSSSIGTLTSASGVDTAYYDPIAKVTYCQAGSTGYRGGAGGASGGEGDPYSGKYTGADGGDGRDGGSVAGYAGGAGGAGTGYTKVPYPVTRSWAEEGYVANGSGGGGAAYGHAGSAGGVHTTEVTSGEVQVVVYGAVGGDGADAIAPAQATYGNGGTGGNGGGSGGNASGATCWYPAYEGNNYTGGNPSRQYAQGGAAGHGSIGGQGGNGCAIIYY